MFIKGKINLFFHLIYHDVEKIAFFPHLNFTSQGTCFSVPKRYEAYCCKVPFSERAYGSAIMLMMHCLLRMQYKISSEGFLSVTHNRACCLCNATPTPHREPSC